MKFDSGWSSLNRIPYYQFLFHIYYIFTKPMEIFLALSSSSLASGVQFSFQ
ncbi:hypothetical protein pb186bvf_003030 [Paramecium bursaria]